MPRMTRKVHTKQLIAATASFASVSTGVLAAAGVQEVPPRPNIVLMMVDDLGWADFGCYGSEIKTPAIDKLASDGVRFRQFYNTAKCAPSRMSLLTGMYPHQTKGPSLANAVTIAEVMKETGYFTAMTGKWHLKGEPTDRGFMRYFGHLSGATHYFTGDKTFRLNGKPWSGFDKTFFTTDANIDYSMRFIEEATRAGKPFFLYIAHNAPHYPLQAKKADFDTYRDRYKSGWDAIRKERFARQKQLGLIPEDWKLPPRPSYIKAWDALNDEQKAWEAKRMAAFAGLVDNIDQNTARLVTFLKDKKLFDNTVIFILSDNGACPYERTRGKDKECWDPASYWTYDTGWAHVGNTPLKYYKQNQHEGGISSPLIVHWPAGLKVKGYCDEPSHLVDIMATCIELGGGRYPSEYHGRSINPLIGKSLVPIFQGKKRDSHTELFFEYANNRALRRGKWKIASCTGGAWELYNIDADRMEQHNLSGQHPEIVREMVAKWEEIRGRKVKVKDKPGIPNAAFQRKAGSNKKNKRLP